MSFLHRYAIVLKVKLCGAAYSFRHFRKLCGRLRPPFCSRSVSVVSDCPGTPLVSVLMGVYYRREDTDLLKRSVESILNQSFSDFELLICDDGSRKEALQLLDGYAERDGRLRLIRPGDKLDLASKLNTCLRCARGAFIARMDDDDCSHTDRFKKQLEQLESHEEIAFVGCNVTLVCQGEPLGTRALPEYPEIRDFYLVQPFVHPALVFRREALEAVNGYSESPRQILCEDYDLLLRLYAAGFRGMNLQEVLLDYTIPATAKGSRTMRHRWNEVLTRYDRYRELGILPSAAPYVVKPLAVGLIPEAILKKIKRKGIGNGQ